MVGWRMFIFYFQFLEAPYHPTPKTILQDTHFHAWTSSALPCIGLPMTASILKQRHWTLEKRNTQLREWQKQIAFRYNNSKMCSCERCIEELLQESSTRRR